jgi:hypothetical protein
MTWQEIWFVVGFPLAALVMGTGTFVIIWLDKPRGKRKKKG